MTLLYSVTLDVYRHFFQICLRIPEPDPDGQIVALPAWVPGSYTIRDPARQIVGIHAMSQGRETGIEKIFKDRWKVDPVAGPLEIYYTLHALDPSVRTAYLDSEYAFFNGPAVFLRVLGQEEATHQMEIQGPGSWQVATGMARIAGEPRSWGTFTACGYQAFCDYPVLMGFLAQADFDTGELPHHLVLAGHPGANLQRLGHDLTTLCRWHQEFWGESPFGEYHFLCMGRQTGYGGLEHRSSSALLCSREDLIPTRPERYAQFLGLASHEYFHSWLVQAIRPAAMASICWEREVLTRDLWIFEGITSYYDTLALCRSGLVSESDYLRELGQEMTRLSRSNGEAWQSLAESSEDAWIKFYHPQPSSPNFEISYYGKGALAALCLDLRLRESSRNSLNLDLVMVRLWQDYGAVNRPLPEGEFPNLMARLAGNEVAGELEEWITSRSALPLETLLETVGIEVRRRASCGSGDRGGTPGRGIRCSLGAQWKRPALPTGAELGLVLQDGAAQAAGLCPGDILLAIDEEQCSSDTLQDQLDAVAPGIPRSLHFFRDGRLRQCLVHPRPAPLDTVYLEYPSNCEERFLARRQEWLRGRPAIRPGKDSPGVSA